MVAVVVVVMVSVIVTRMATMQFLDVIVVRGSRHAMKTFGQITERSRDLGGAVVGDLEGDFPGLMGGSWLD
jgi:hypothetical protein